MRKCSHYCGGVRSTHPIFWYDQGNITHFIAQPVVGKAFNKEQLISNTRTRTYLNNVYSLSVKQ